jgi:hypothetical protein
MRYVAAGNRCAVRLADLALPMSQEQVLDTLRQLGFIEVSVSLVQVARSRIGRSRYELGADASLAPSVVDCSSFTKWIYAEVGIWIPRFSVQQSQEGRAVAPEERQEGDLVFTQGRQDFYSHDVPRGVGHVGLYTKRDTVIHATQGGVVETEYEVFVRRGFRGVRRIVLSGEVKTFVATRQLVESSDDYRWLVLRSLA